VKPDGLEPHADAALIFFAVFSLFPFARYFENEVNDKQLGERFAVREVLNSTVYVAGFFRKFARTSAMLGYVGRSWQPSKRSTRS
jgi:hypothetical protein